MSKVRFTLNILAVTVFTLMVASMAQAQATRTWVSGVGDDVNPCSRTAPCKTWAGAISKTFINGEIDALDEGGFGTLTITKSITIEGTFGSGFGSTLSSGVTAFNINMTDVSGNDPQHTARLRNLSITGIGSSGSVGTRTGINGIRILSTNAANSHVFVENCLITDFSQRGISDERASSGTIHVTDTTVRNTTQTGIVILGAGGISGNIDRTRFENCGGTTFAGLSVDNASSKVTATECVANACGIGFFVNGGAALNLESCTAANNTTGLASTSTGKMRLSNCNVTANGTGVSFASNAVVLSYGNNHISGNTAGDTLPAASTTNPQ